MKKFLSTSQLIVTVLFSLLISGCSKDSDPAGPDLESCITMPENSAPRANELLSFKSCSSNATSFLWEFGDGGTSTDEHPDHMYNREGRYTVKLTASDDKNEVTSTQEITIHPSECISHTGFISKSETWKKGCHIVEFWISVRNGATLTIEPGAVVRFKNSGSIEAGYSEAGTIIAEGTAAEPILFTSFYDTPAPGDWDGFSIGGFTSTPASFKHCLFEYGGMALGDDPSAMLRIYDGGQVKVDQCEFRKSLSYAVELEDDSRFTLFTNNHIHDIDDFAMHLSGNNAGSIGAGNVIESKGVLIDAHQVIADTEWRGLTCPYVTESNLWVGSPAGNTLTFGPGVRVEFQGSQMLLPSHTSSIATLISNGTAENPVVLTAHDPAATERWGGVSLSDRFTANTFFRHTVFEKAKSNQGGNGVVSIGAGTLNMEHCRISGEKQFGIIMGTGAELGVFRGNDIGEVGTYSMYLQVQNLSKIGDENTFSGNKNVYCPWVEILEDVTFPEISVYYLIDRDMHIGSPQGNTVTLEPGVKLLLYGYTIHVAKGYNAIDPMPGTLKAVGTAAKPIIIERKPIDSPVWGNTVLIEFSGSDTSPESILEYCTIIGGSMGVRVSNIYNQADNPYPTIRNCHIKDCTSHAIYIANSYPLIQNNTYTGNGTNGPFNQ